MNVFIRRVNAGNTSPGPIGHVACSIDVLKQELRQSHRTGRVCTREGTVLPRSGGRRTAVDTSISTENSKMLAVEYDSPTGTA